MRISFAFVTIVAVLIAVPALLAGRLSEGLGASGIAVFSGVLFWRNLRDPEVTRAQGQQVSVTLTPGPGKGIAETGTFARVEDLYGDVWDVVLDRTPEQGDFGRFGTVERGWMWLNRDNKPQRIRLNYSTTWESCNVTKAVRVIQVS